MNMFMTNFLNDSDIISIHINFIDNSSIYNDITLYWMQDTYLNKLAMILLIHIIEKKKDLIFDT